MILGIPVWVTVAGLVLLAALVFGAVADAVATIVLYDRLAPVLRDDCALHRAVLDGRAPSWCPPR